MRYRGILKTQGVVEYRSDWDSQTVTLCHDGPLAQFEAAFMVTIDKVALTCNFITKVPFMILLVSKSRDQAMRQAVPAMGSYARLTAHNSCASYPAFIA